MLSKVVRNINKLNFKYLYIFEGIIMYISLFV